MAIRVDLCCNDDNGNFTGRAWQIELDPIECELEESLWPPVGVRVSYPDDKHIKIGREVYKILDKHAHTGNIYWDSVWMSGLEVTRLINYLMKLKYWQCSCGEEWIFERFKEKKPLYALDEDAHNRFARMKER